MVQNFRTEGIHSSVSISGLSANGVLSFPALAKLVPRKNVDLDRSYGIRIIPALGGNKRLETQMTWNGSCCTETKSMSYSGVKLVGNLPSQGTWL
ncbi:hypothetical protein VTN96DRAFT_8813 [Rasamsonia emersonii]